jgi:hypothetical protein
MLFVKFNLSLFHGEADWNASAFGVSALLRASVTINEQYLRDNPDAPSPFERDERGKLKLRYLVAHAMESVETFRSYPEIIKAGGSDCDGLLPVVIAWQRVREGDNGADIYITWKRGLARGTLKYHVLGINGRGEVADWCRFNGMGRSRES